MGSTLAETESGSARKVVDEMLAESTNAAADRETFFRTQIIFWLLCAIDGHAKNFSIHLEQGGGYRLTPLYDGLSSQNGHGGGGQEPTLSLDGIARRHWNEAARRCGFARDAEKLIDDILSRTAQVIKEVEGRLPRNFPSKVAEPILKGLKQAAARLAQPRT